MRDQCQVQNKILKIEVLPLKIHQYWWKNAVEELKYLNLNVSGIYIYTHILYIHKYLNSNTEYTRIYQKRYKLHLFFQ